MQSSLTHKRVMAIEGKLYVHNKIRSRLGGAVAHITGLARSDSGRALQM